MQRCTKSRQSGRNRYRVYDSAQPLGRPGRTFSRPSSFTRFEESELFLLYQPLFSLEDRIPDRRRGVGALATPERGVVLTRDFVPFAEQYGLIGRIDAFILERGLPSNRRMDHPARAGRQSSLWRSTSPALELSDPEFAGHVAEVIGRHGINPTLLCLEITETALIGDVRERPWPPLPKLGVRLALDDFGTGYSTLSHLQHAESGHLEDRPELRRPDQPEPRDREIVAAVMAMSRALGTTVVGEGIETSDQLDALTGLDCDQGQGFLLRPLSPEAVVALVG